MKFYTILSVILIGLLISCTEEPLENVEYSFEDFSIEVPLFMKSIEDRKYDLVAEFEVDSSINNKYEIDATVYKDTFVFENGERKTLKKYYKLVADDLLTFNLESGSMNSAEEFEISRNKAMVFEITGKYKHHGTSEDYFFLSGVIEASNSFYEITVWTPLANKKDLKPIMNDIIFSFKTNSN